MTTTADLPTIWFDRHPLPVIRDLLEGRATIVSIEAGSSTLSGIDLADGIVAGAAIRYNRSVFDQAPRLRVICRAGIGYDNLDLDDAAELGIAACNAPDAPTVSTSEQAMGLILAITKGLRESQARLERQEGNYFAHHMHLELDGSTLALIGVGRIGGRVAGMAKAIGMDVVAYDPYQPDQRFTDLGVRRAPTLAAAVDGAHVVSVHAPLSAETHHLVDAALIEQMMDGVYLVNTARGGLVDDTALIEALDRGKVRAAGLDVTDPEPLPGGHPLLGRDDVVVTPHVASATGAGARRIFEHACEIVLATLAGNRPASLLNPSAWPGRNR